MQSTGGFLRTILPEEGLKCIAWFEEGQLKHYWSENIDDLEMFALARDFEGKTVYHGCASYRSCARRGENVRVVRAFWLDVDAGPTEPSKPSKSYADTIGAYRATESFRQRVGLPAPLYVRSGPHGLHVYWPLVAGIPPDLWLEHARGLKQLCRLHGFSPDATRTADIASILRPVGTHNRKNGEAFLVVSGESAGPYDIGDFAALRPVANGSAGSKAFVGGSQPVGPRSSSDAPSLANQLATSIREANVRPARADAIATQCAQIAAFRASKGNLPEPLWYEGIGVLAWCVDGDTRAHDWSNGHARYTPEETNRKMAQKRKLSGASLCSGFYDLAPAGCTGCPWLGKIKSPIVLGYENGSENVSRMVVPQLADNDSGSSDLPDLPDGFKWEGQRLVRTGESNKGQSAPILISEYPLFLESIGTSEIESDTFSYNFRLRLPLGERNITISAKQFMGPDGISHMFSRGAVIHDRELFRKYVMSAVDQFNRNQHPTTRYEQFGWKDEERSFLWGRSLYTSHNILPANAVDEITTRGKLLNCKVGGSLSNWTAAGNRLFARDCEPHAFALVCSFAAPLMRFHSTDEGGAILALVGPRGSGKTTALDAAGSVWGQHRALDLNTFDTRNSRGVNLGVLGNLPVIYDEMEKQDAGVLREFVAIFTNGRDRARATVDGGIRHEARTWQTIVIGAANRSVVELVAGTNDSEALSSRILELPGHLPEGMTDTEATALRNEMKANCGYAADQYVRYIVQPEVNAWIRSELTRLTAEVWKRTGLKSEHRFWVRSIGSAWVAAKIVQNLKLLHFSPDELINWAMSQISHGQSDPKVRAKTLAVSLVTEFINAHLDGIVTVTGPWQRGHKSVLVQPKPRYLVIRHELNPARWWFAEKPFKQWLDKMGHSPKQIIADLVTGELASEKTRLVTLGAGTDIPGGQVLCLEINGQHPALSGVLASVESFQGAVATVASRG